MANVRLCSIPECGKSGRITRGMCGMHYKRYIDGRPLDAPAARALKSLYKDGDGPRDFIEKALQSETDDCIVWPFNRHAKGYGQLSSAGKCLKAHRIVCERAHGKQPDMCACHSCDNPPCINPRHLHWGTNQENMTECVQRGRRKGMLGQQHPGSKLTEQDVRDIRASSKSHGDLAAAYGVNYYAIRDVRSRRTWSHI